jgi:hypothetical protein
MEKKSPKNTGSMILFVAAVVVISLLTIITNAGIVIF